MTSNMPLAFFISFLFEDETLPFLLSDILVRLPRRSDRNRKYGWRYSNASELRPFSFTHNNETASDSNLPFEDIREDTP